MYCLVRSYVERNLVMTGLSDMYDGQQMRENEKGQKRPNMKARLRGRLSCDRLGDPWEVFLMVLPSDRLACI